MTTGRGTAHRLNEGLAVGRKLTLIPAPAGFGKSTLVSEWLTSCGRSAAWLSLDDNDHDPVRFLIYLTSALQRISSDSGVGILESLQSPQPPPIEAILTALLNEFTAIPNGFILVLDDYHVLEAKAIDEALTFLVDHLPPQIHLVITTREDPALPIPRLRARGQVTELRAADLRFTPAHAAGFLNQMMGLNLSEDAVAVLEAHGFPQQLATRSLFTDEMDRNRAEWAIDSLKSSTARMSILQIRVLGGAMARVPEDATAFAHRKRKLMITLAAVYENGEDAVLHETWISRFADGLRDSKPGVYVNFLGNESEARIREAYPGQTWNRLVKVKTQYDPTNLFHLNQNVPPHIDKSSA